VRRVITRSLPLHRTKTGFSRYPNIPITPGLAGYPLNGIVAVRSFDFLRSCGIIFPFRS
jgi:hypothetical protein